MTAIPWSPWRYLETRGTLANGSRGYNCTVPGCKRPVALCRCCLLCGAAWSFCLRHGRGGDARGLSEAIAHLTTHTPADWALTGLDE